MTTPIPIGQGGFARKVQDTAAERDRLRQTVIDGEKRCIELLEGRDRLKAALQQAEEGAAIIVGQISVPQEGLSPETTAWVVRQATAISNRARAAIAKTKEPTP